MSFRAKIFIIAVILAILTSYTQEPFPQPVTPSFPLTELPQPVTTSSAQTESDLVAPPAPPMETPPPPSAGEKETETTAGQENEQKESSQEATATNGVNIGLSAQVRQKVASFLNTCLANEYVLYTKTLKCHWNVQGIVFHDFHAMFKEQYEKLFEIIDLIAERARALGAPALGSLQEFKTLSRLKEIIANTLAPLEMVKELLADHEMIIRSIREAINETNQLGDQGTSNFLQDLIIKHEKIAWMLRATAQ